MQHHPQVTLISTFSLVLALALTLNFIPALAFIFTLGVLHDVDMLEHVLQSRVQVLRGKLQVRRISQRVNLTF